MIVIPIIINYGKEASCMKNIKLSALNLVPIREGQEIKMQLTIWLHSLKH